MTENASVVIFPSDFSRNKINQLIVNIKKILKIKGQNFRSVKRDNDVIIVDANDPVFASAAINLLFGIKRIAIAKKIQNEFKEIISEVSKLGGNLLIKGEKFFVHVEGHTQGFSPGDVEIAATSLIIEQRTKLGAKPGTREKHDKLIYTYLTKKNAYVCIFIDKGHGGIPLGWQNQTALCPLYDELSGISCMETIKQGFDVSLLIFYQKNSELLSLAKIINLLSPMTLQTKIKLDVYKINIKTKGKKNNFDFLNSIISLLIKSAVDKKIKWVSLPFSPLIFPSQFIEKNLEVIFENGSIPFLPLSGLDENVFESAKEIGLSKWVEKVKQTGSNKFLNFQESIDLKKTNKVLENKRTISFKLGPNSLHEILDLMKSEH